MPFREHRRRTYKNPPIEEAICAFHFEEGAEWDITLPGRLHERIRDLYDGKPQQQAGIEARIEPEVGNSGFAFRNAMQRIQLPNKAGTRLVAITSKTLSVHMLRPYSGWEEEFKGNIDRVCEAFSAITDIRIASLGLRYINRIEIPHPQLALGDYFNFEMKLPEDYPLPAHAFFHRIESKIDDSETSLVLTFGNTKATSGKSAFLLDLDLTSALSEPVAITEAAREMADLRVQERHAFESLITDNTRSLFDDA